MPSLAPRITTHALITLLATLLASCTTQLATDTTATVNSSASLDSEMAARPTDNAGTVARPSYDADSLADLLVAEVAAQRDALGVTLEYYRREALAHGDPLVAEQGARLAAYLDDPQLASELGTLWLAGAPASEEARRLLAIAAVQTGDSEAAAAQIDQLLQQQPRQALMQLIKETEGLSGDDSQTLLAALASLTEQHSDLAPLWYARALQYQQQGDLQQALATNETALRRDPEHEDALLLKGRLLYNLERQDEAFSHLTRLLKKYPDAKRVRVLYIRMLLEQGRFDDAAEQLAEIEQRHPQDRDLRFSLAVFGLQQGAHSQAGATLQTLLDEGYRSDDIHLYLAQAAELDDDPNAAIQHYLQVGPGPAQLRARVQAARLMYQHRQDQRAAALFDQLRDEQPEKAPTLYAAEAEMLGNRGDQRAGLTLLNEVITQFPDSTDLLYARAMLSEKLDNLAQLEADLLRMLELKPGDATALNALGYTLADRTDRLDEAHGYIRQALEQRPDDPAILDSMGWVLYRLGRPDDALAWLQRAWELFPDPEVASHLGEVLWVLGQQEAARDLWRAALETHPDDQRLAATVERLTGSARP